MTGMWCFRRAACGLASRVIAIAVLSAAGVPIAHAQALPAAAADTSAHAPSPAPAAAGTPAYNEHPVVGMKRVQLTGRGGNIVRFGPGSGFAIVGTYAKDTSFPVIAKSGPWYGVRLSDTETGWIHSSLCKEMDDLSGLEFRPNARLYSRTGSYVLSGYSGAYAFDRKSNSLVLGGRLGYYIFDRLQVEAGASWTRVHRPAEIVESLFGLTLEAENFPMLFYQMNVVWELLPGRQMVPYVGAGVGSALLLGRSESTVNFGAGTKLFLSKRTAMRWEVRDYRFHNHTSSDNGINNNIEFTLGSEVLF
jgi:outer membrane beta-barrel protein